MTWLSEVLLRYDMTFKLSHPKHTEFEVSLTGFFECGRGILFKVVVLPTSEHLDHVQLATPGFTNQQNTAHALKKSY